jgi:hypothetical protein
MTNETHKTLNAVRTLALKDLDTATDEEIRAELLEEGIEPDAMADDLVSASLRQHAITAKEAMKDRAELKIPRPSLARIKEKIAAAFAAEPQLGTAFREGTRQSDGDLESLYDDLVLMGKISPNDDGR